MTKEGRARYNRQRQQVQSQLSGAATTTAVAPPAAATLPSNSEPPRFVNLSAFSYRRHMEAVFRENKLPSLDNQLDSLDKNMDARYAECKSQVAKNDKASETRQKVLDTEQKEVWRKKQELDAFDAKIQGLLRQSHQPKRDDRHPEREQQPMPTVVAPSMLTTSEPTVAASSMLTTSEPTAAAPSVVLTTSEPTVTAQSVLTTSEVGSESHCLSNSSSSSSSSSASASLPLQEANAFNLADIKVETLEQLKNEFLQRKDDANFTVEQRNQLLDKFDKKASLTPGCFDWLLCRENTAAYQAVIADIRAAALEQLDKEIAAINTGENYPTENDKTTAIIGSLNKALTLDIFKEHRSNYLRFSVTASWHPSEWIQKSTRAVITLNAKLAEYQKKLETPKSNEPSSSRQTIT